jgi:hypothetical protein
MTEDRGVEHARSHDSAADDALVSGAPVAGHPGEHRSG